MYVKLKNVPIHVLCIALNTFYMICVPDAVCYNTRVVRNSPRDLDFVKRCHENDKNFDGGGGGLCILYV